MLPKSFDQLNGLTPISENLLNRKDRGLDRVSTVAILQGNKNFLRPIFWVSHYLTIFLEFISSPV